MSLLKKLAGETAIYGVSSILGRVLSWGILTPYLTNTFLPEEFGIYSQLYTYIAILLVIFTYRLETAYFRFASSRYIKREGLDPKGDVQFSTAAMSLLFTTSIFTALLLFFTSDVADWLGFVGNERYVTLFVVIVALDALSALPFARLRLQQRPLRFAFIRISGIVINILAIFFFLELCPWLIERGVDWAELFYTPSNRLAYLFYANIIASGFVLVLLSVEYVSVHWKFDRAMWRKMIWYALPLVIAGLAGTVNQLIGIPLLGQIGPGDELSKDQVSGIYSAAARLAVFMNLFIQAFNYAAEPFFFRQASSSSDRKIYADVGRAFALVGALAFVGIMLYIEVIQYFLGEDFREGLGILPILLIANFFLGLFYNFSVAYKLTDRTRIGGYIAIVGAVITLTFNIYFIPILSYFAPAWAALLCYGFMAVAGYWVSQRYFPINYAIGRMTLYLVSAIVLYMISALIHAFLFSDLWLRLLINTVLLLGYLYILYRTERPWLRSVLRSG